MMDNTRKCYQLNAVGNSVNGYKFKMRSQDIFLDKEEALRYIPEFKQKCCDQSYFECAFEEGLAINVIELNLIG